ncbi:MAG: hypothetical protein AAGA81_11905 [Acidobacteriota bacterium]
MKKNQAVTYKDGRRALVAEDIASIVARLSREANESARDVIDLLGDSDTTLVPVPSSKALETFAVPNRATAAIADQLAHEGFGGGARYHLRRIRTLPKSAYLSKATERPDVDFQAKTLGLPEHAPAPARVCLIDDVVTTGTTLMGCALKLRERYPDLEIVAFSVARTVQGDIDSRIVVPKVETVSFYPDGRYCRRR